MSFAQKQYAPEIIKDYIKKMADFSLAIAKTINVNPIICITASILHKMADGVIGTNRSNTINPVLREIGYNANTIDAINNCINHLLPENRVLQTTKEEQVVGDAYLLTYWDNLTTFTPQFHFDISRELWSLMNEKSQERIELSTSRKMSLYH
ncbi:MAG: hypothetical protein ACXAC7_04115 [Candidatus Hodarchaeales archaeon]